MYVRSAKQATRRGPLKEEDHLGRLRALPKDLVKGGGALALVAEAFRDLSGLGFCSMGS